LSGPDKSERVRGKVVLVLTDRSSGRAIALPGELRSSISTFVISG
jgi:acyl-CoA thioesterase FadM